MTYWNDRAASIPDEIKNHEWYPILFRHLKRHRPELYQNLKENGSLFDYLKVSVADAQESLEQRIARGDPEDQARSQVLSELLPVAPEDQDRTEDWEQEGAEEDQAAEVLDQLPES